MSLSIINEASPNALTRNWTTHPHAEAYKASPLVWGWIIQAQRRRFWLPQYPLSYENWRFSLIGIEAKRFQIICLAKCDDVAYAHITHNAIANIWIYLWNAKQIITFSFAYFKTSNKPQKGFKKNPTILYNMFDWGLYKIMCGGGEIKMAVLLCSASGLL